MSNEAKNDAYLLNKQTVQKYEWQWILRLIFPLICAKIIIEPRKFHQDILLAQSDGAVEYAYCFSAEEKDTPAGVIDMTLKIPDGQVPVMLELWEM